MKSKKSMVILVPLVIVIWGVVIWKVKDYKPSGGQDIQVVISPEIETENDTSGYTLRFGYSDPFLRSTYWARPSVPSGKALKANNIKQVEISRVATIVRPSDLVYRGAVEGYRHKLGLLEIAGDRVLVSEYSTVGEYTILLVREDSLTLNYRDKRFTYEKE